MLREEARLSSLVALLRQVRSACLAGRLDDLNALLEQQKTPEQGDDPLAQEREQLRKELAAFLNVAPQQITLTYLLQSLPRHLREQLEPTSGRLRALLREAEQLTHHNAALLGYSLSFLHRLFHTLTGVCGVERYSPSGRRVEGRLGNLLQVRRG